MRIALALPSLHVMARGAEVAFDSIGDALARAGHDTTLIGGGPVPQGRSYEYIRIPYEHRHGRGPSIGGTPLSDLCREAAFARQLSKVLGDGRFDATIACTFPMVHLACRRHSRREGSAHVWVTQTGDWPARARHETSRLRAAHYGLFDCDGLVCVNPEHYEANRNNYRAALIPNGVDTTRFRPGDRDAARRARGLWADGRKIALMVSSLHPYKRVLEGIQVAAQIDGLSLVVAGSGPLEAEVRAEASRLLSPDRFRIVSLPPDAMPELYRAADVFLHMSLDEPFGIAYVEALAAGLPVVADDNARSRWILDDLAYLPDTTVPADVVTALEAALTDDQASRAAPRLERAEAFEWDEIARRYAAFVSGCISGEPSSASEGPSRTEA